MGKTLASKWGKTLFLTLNQKLKFLFNFLIIYIKYFAKQTKIEPILQVLVAKTIEQSSFELKFEYEKESEKKSKVTIIKKIKNNFISLTDRILHEKKS